MARDGTDGVSRETELKAKSVLEERYGVSRETLDRLETYVDVLRRWNRAINLVSRHSIEDVWMRHILDSAQLTSLMPAQPSARKLRILDFGAGAGFPGLVLALLKHGYTDLVEADQRKAAFLREVIRQTDAPACVHACRVEEVAAPVADVVTARAFGRVDILLNHAERLAAPAGIALFPKGRTGLKELTQTAPAWKIAIERHVSCTDPDGVIFRIALGGEQPR